MDESPAQWQIPVGLQMVPPFILGTGLFFFPESVRWLVKKGRIEEAWDALTWLRASDGEFDENPQQAPRRIIANSNVPPLQALKYEPNLRK